MLSLWRTYPDLYREMEDFRRRVDRLFSDPHNMHRRTSSANWPPTNVSDRGEEFLVQAEVPGLSNQDLSVEATQDTLTISGQRKTRQPEGYAVHRQERAPFQFSRSFSFPVKIDPEQVSATVRDGLLTVRLGKKPEHRPQSITVTAG